MNTTEWITITFVELDDIVYPGRQMSTTGAQHKLFFAKLATWRMRTKLYFDTGRYRQHVMAQHGPA